MGARTIYFDRCRCGGVPLAGDDHDNGGRVFVWSGEGVLLCSHRDHMWGYDRILSRTVSFSQIVWRYLQAHPRATRFDQALADDGWKFVLSTRLIPFFPFKLSNYAFGITRFSFRDFVIGTFFGIWPITMFNVYVGSITADLATLGTPGGSKSPVEWLFFGMGFAISIVVVIYTMHRARESLRQITPDPEQGKVEERSNYL